MKRRFVATGSGMTGAMAASRSGSVAKASNDGPSPSSAETSAD